MGTYPEAGYSLDVRRLAVALAIVAMLAAAGFAAAFLFARGNAQSQPRFLPPIPTASERP